MDGYLTQLATAARAAVLPEGGESSYFSRPAPTLDPNLFDGTQLRPQVRSQLLRPLISFLRDTGLNDAASWLHVWLAGSGVSYQWSSPRGNGDLDVLFGADYPALINDNPQLATVTQDDFADRLDEILKARLWPRTAHTRIGDAEYEVTYYISPGIGTSITAIHPYAAYSLTRDTWDITPPELTADPASLYSADWYAQAHRDRQIADDLAGRFTTLAGQLPVLAAGSGPWVSTASDLRRVTDQATTLFDDIHLGRRAAFTGSGHGYSDWANFRWQYLKASGAIGKLRAIRAARRQAAEASDRELYGGTPAGARTLLSRTQYPGRLTG